MVNMRCGSSFDRFGRLDVLVNNAGIGTGSPFLEMSADAWDRVIDVNLSGHRYASTRRPYAGGVGSADQAHACQADRSATRHRRGSRLAERTGRPWVTGAIITADGGYTLASDPLVKDADLTD